MRQRTRSCLVVGVVGLLFLLAGACESGGGGVPDDTDLGNIIFTDTSGDLGPGGPDLATIDAGPDLPGPADVEALEELGGPDLSIDIPGVDHTPPEVIDHSPLDDADNVPVEGTQIQVVFSEPLKENTVVLHNTFQVTDANGSPVAGAIAVTVDEERHGLITFTPSAALVRGSSYDVTVSPSITDLSRNPLQEFTRFRFFTEPLPSPAHHVAAAERYAPTIRHAVDGGGARFDVLTGFDFDGDWDLGNNLTNARQATSFAPKVYYAVLETHSHLFVNYVYYHTYNNHEDARYRHGNHVGGAQVVVQRHPEERPIALFVYTKTRGDEDILAFVTSESGIDQAPAAAEYVDGVFPQAELFPGGRHEGYLTARNHQSCSWLDRDNTAPPSLCLLTASQAASMPVVTYAWEDGNVDVVDGSGGFPISSGGDTWGYELEDLLGRLWTRRKEVAPAGAVFGQTYIFQSNSDELYETRPGAGTTMPAAFLAPEGQAGEFSRPPWAWGWRPQLSGYVTLQRGTFFLDPAYFVRKRFPGAFESWDPSTRAGFSMNYCYNPYLLLNFLDAQGNCQTQG